MCDVFGYVRVSTRNQVVEGYSLQEQHDEIVSYCKLEKLNLVEVFEDRGVSGATANEDELSIDRNGLTDMLSQVTAEISFVVVLNTSRLWRSDIAKILIQRSLKSFGIDVRAIDRPTYSIYSTDPSETLINGVFELLDVYERLEIALKLRRGRKQKAMLGGYAGGGVPLGYTAKRGSGVIEQDDSKIGTVERIFELRWGDGKLSLWGIADIVNSEGLTTAKGKLFTATQIKRVLDNYRFYSGVYSYDGVSVEKGKHKKLFDNSA